MAGRKTKYQEDFPERVEKLALEGKIDIEIYQALGISNATFYDYQNTYPEFSEALKRGKAVQDDKVESALRKRAMGYSCPETKPQWVNDKDGGHWEYAELIKHYPPDPTSMIFWLKNRRPERWREKQEFEHSGSIGFHPIQSQLEKLDTEQLIAIADEASNPQPTSKPRAKKTSKDNA